MYSVYFNGAQARASSRRSSCLRSSKPRAQQLYNEYKSRVSGDRWEVHGPNGTPVTGSSRSTAEQAKREFLNRWNTASVNKKVPNAPYKGGDWAELAVKRMLREAAEKG